MTFAQVKGNDEVRRALIGMVDSGKVPHAIMFHEDDGGEGIALALSFIQYLYCRGRSGGDSCGICPECNRNSKLIHPDVHYVFPTASGHVSDEYAAQWRELVSGGAFNENAFKNALGLSEKPVMIAVSEANSLLQKLSLSAYEGGYRTVLMYLPELMNVEAANKLLKMIEEPPARTQFVLVTHDPAKVLPTISSRCQRIRVVPVPGAAGTLLDEAVPQLFTNLMQALLSKDLFSVLQAAAEVSSLKNRESVKAFCTFAVGKFRTVFLLQQGMASLAGEDAEAAGLAARCRRSFPRKAMEQFDRANMLVGRNVNAKIVFADLADKLYFLI